MEADGVVEGFLKSKEMHGLKFNRIIGKIKMSSTFFCIIERYLFSYLTIFVTY
jgi:hypothetical protein